MNLYTQMIGGIGDILLSMMKPGAHLGYFPALKRRGDKTMVVAHANTDAAFALFRDLPCVDHVRFRGRSMVVDTAPGQWFEVLKRWDGLLWEPPGVVLDEEEQRLLTDLVSDPYVAVHAAASLDEKVPPHIHKLILELRETGVRTVMLGIESTDDAPSFAGNRMCGYRSVLREEIILPPSLRLHVAAAQHARKFIGTLSCFNCAAQLAVVPSFVIVNRSLAEPRVYNMMHRNGAVIRSWNDGTKKVEDIYREAAQWAAR